MLLDLGCDIKSDEMLIHHSVYTALWSRKISWQSFACWVQTKDIKQSYKKWECCISCKFIQPCTGRYRYNAVTSYPHPQNRHPRVHPWGKGMRCLLWVQNLIFVQPLLLQWRLSYHDVHAWDRVITASDYIPMKKKGAPIFNTKYDSHGNCTVPLQWADKLFWKNKTVNRVYLSFDLFHCVWY